MGGCVCVCGGVVTEKLKESKTRASDGLTGNERRRKGPDRKETEREREIARNRGERMKEEWVGGRAARTRRRRRMRMRMRRREKLALATVMGVPLPVPARSKVYCGFNFTFAQPIGRRLRLLRGTLTHSENLTVKDLKLDSASPTNSLCSLFFFPSSPQYYSCFYFIFRPF